jgi:hypothetical protein
MTGAKVLRDRVESFTSINKPSANAQRIPISQAMLVLISERVATCRIRPHAVLQKFCDSMKTIHHILPTFRFGK